MLRVNGLPPGPGARAETIRTWSVSLREMAEGEGVAEVSFQASAGTRYAVLGHIYDETDARAHELEIVLVTELENASDEQRAATRKSIFGRRVFRRATRMFLNDAANLADPVSPGLHRRSVRRARLCAVDRGDEGRMRPAPQAVGIRLRPADALALRDAATRRARSGVRGRIAAAARGDGGARMHGRRHRSCRRRSPDRRLERRGRTRRLDRIAALPRDLRRRGVRSAGRVPPGRHECAFRRTAPDSISPGRRARWSISARSRPGLDFIRNSVSVPDVRRAGGAHHRVQRQLERRDDGERRHRAVPPARSRADGGRSRLARPLRRAAQVRPRRARARPSISTCRPIAPTTS